MTELTLRPASVLESGLAFVAQLFKEMFRATPLGTALSIVRTKR